MVRNNEGAASRTFAFTVKPQVSKIEPTASGSGGGLLTVTGTGFKVSAVSVTVGGTSCTILYSSTTRIQCRVPQNSADGKQSIIVKHSSTTLTLPAEAKTWTYTAANTPTVTALVTGGTFSGKETEVRCTGTRLSGVGYLPRGEWSPLRALLVQLH